MEILAKPGVAAIIEKRIEGILCILVQNREKIDAPKETGLLEIPAGKIKAFEPIYDTLRREVKEETGLNVTEICGEQDSNTITANGYKVISYELFCNTQNICGDYPIMVSTFICKGEGKLLESSNESQNITWMPIEELARLLQDNANIIYPMHISALRKYIDMKMR
ncbi:NUDIX domain-containing protein [Clostridiaceae bacterium M8S5]|nr:NUDIX domain-containing protein [Clostridiaceae bacterium M8S5]